VQYCYNSKNIPPQNLKFYYLGISQGLKLCNLMEKNPFDFSYAKYHSKYFGLIWVNIPFFHTLCRPYHHTPPPPPPVLLPLFSDHLIPHSFSYLGVFFHSPSLSGHKTDIGSSKYDSTLTSCVACFQTWQTPSSQQALCKNKLSPKLYVVLILLRRKSVSPPLILVPGNVRAQK